MRRRVENPGVSVVIPTYNRAHELQRCLASLEKQTFTDFEVLVCDDGSTDGTSEAWQKFADTLDITYDRAENFGGPARPRNRGIALARAPYVAFLDSDDWWEPRKLELSLRRLEQGADVVYHDLYLATAAHARHPWRVQQSRDLKSPAFNDMIANGNAMTNSSVVVRKSLLQGIGGFSEERDLIAAEDYDAWLRIAQVTERFERIAEPLGSYFWTPSGSISSPGRIVANLSAIERRFGDSIGALEAARHIFWIPYCKGRAYYRLKSYGPARQCLGAIRWRGTPASIYLKSKLIALWIALRHAA